MTPSRILYGIASFLIFSLLSLYFLHPITNLVGDLGFYLKTGEIISKTGVIPSTNLFSYTNPQFLFINPNWFSEVIFYQIYQAFGFNGLIYLAMVTILAAFGLIFIYAARTFNWFATILIACISIHVLYERTEVKPELFSYLFLAVFITILYKYREAYTRWIYLLIPLSLLWVNMHIYFFIGILVLLLFSLDAILAKKATRYSKKSVTLFGVTVVSFLVMSINPHFMQGLFYPLFVLNNYAFPVEENINFVTALSGYSDTTFLYFGIAATVLWVTILISIKKLYKIDIFLAIVFTIVGFYAVRAFPLFVIGTFIPAVKSLSRIVEFFDKKMSEEKVGWLKIGLFTLLGIALFPTITLDMQIHGLGLGVTDSASKAVNFLEKNDINGPIYNNYDVGNYLIYALYPKEKVFVDGRPEAYPKDFFENVYSPMQESSTIFHEVSKKYNFNVIIIKHTDTSPGTIAQLQYLVKDNYWKMVYLNSSIVIFLKNAPKNQQIIKRYTITQDNVVIQKEDLSDKTNVGQLVNLFRNIGWEHPWLTMNLKYLNFDPNNCSALQNIAYIYQKGKSPDASVYESKFESSCSQ